MTSFQSRVLNHDYNSESACEKGRGVSVVCVFRLSRFLPFLFYPHSVNATIHSVSNLGGEHSIMSRMRRSFLILSAVFVASSAFTIPNQKSAMIHNTFKGPTSNLRMLPDASSLLTAVEVFDGSTIVDTVVVSGVFWSSLKSKFLAVVIGQVLAAVVFAILSTFFASRISQLGDFVSEKLFSSDLAAPKKKFIKATDLPKVDADFGKLFICLAIDVIGSSSELVPILGELTDVIYAPIAATVLRSLYGGSNVVFALEFAEEILPFTDILPLATLW
jgi:hypothetical protein